VLQEVEDKYMRKNIIIFILVILIVTISPIMYMFVVERMHADDPHESSGAEDVIAGLETAIAQATKDGDYHCCIDPACTMCYLGSWIFEPGTCNCDEAIAKGEFDKVCPECKKGIEEGDCSSAEVIAIGCDINKKNHD